jgi:hypothetical protein
MIQRLTVNDRPAIAMYMDNQFQPVDSELAASLVKLTFTDAEGGMVFLVPDESPTTVDYDPDEPRDPQGR